MNLPGARIALGICGASGMIYAEALVSMFARSGAELSVCASRAAKPVFGSETGTSFESFAASVSARHPNARFYADDDFSAPIASGSYMFDAMAVCPCSMKTLGLIANGIAQNLICRAADVALKERRRLVLVPRETPLALSHLRNMCAVAEAGGVVLPACPAFYGGEKTVSDIANFIAARTVSAMGFKQDSLAEWGQAKKMEEPNEKGL